MTLTDRSRALVEKIDAVSKLPMLMRASKAEALIREAAAILVELSMRVEQISRMYEDQDDA